MSQPLPQPPEYQQPFAPPEPEQGNARYPYGKPQWSAQRPVVVKLKPVNGNSLISFFLALFGFSIPAVIVGHVALYQLSFLGMERGKALAWVGLVLGYLETIAWVIFVIWVGVHIAAFFTALSTGFMLPLPSTPSPSVSDGGIGELFKELERLSGE